MDEDNVEKKEKIAVYPGSFDPITLGHIDVIKRALNIFDRIIVLVAEDGRKNPLFSAQERVEMINEAIAHLDADVDSFDGLLVDYLKSKGLRFVIRGMRAVSDFEHEFQMATTNKKLYPEIETYFVMTDKKYFYLNSTTVKELAKLGDCGLEEFVPENIEAALKRKFSLVK